MWKEPLTAVTPSLIQKINKLKDLGCDILRFAVPDEASARELGVLSEAVDLPLVADIHFDYRLALACLDYPIAKIRINPGNIGARWKVEEVVSKAKDCGVPIRIGVNSGSLPAKLRKEEDTAEAMVKAGEEELAVLTGMGFEDVVVSLKSSDIETTVRANERFAASHDIPIHLGITEAGPLLTGAIKNAIGISRLLRMGIGNTIRVSLSDTPEREIIAGREILSAENKYRNGVNIVSCPQCGRASFDVHNFLSQVQADLYAIRKNLTVAVMGCVVNGPGEAKHADIGITGSKDGAVIFKKGKIVAKVPSEKALEAFKHELSKLL
jgi:(E)-4-hydroxy-3-methylbut-2-enyl-diphosphate synthase